MNRYIVFFEPPLIKTTSQPLSWENQGKIREPPPPPWDGFPTFTGFEL